MLPLFVLTRTSRRPRMFAQLRAALAQQSHPFTHVVHSDDPSDTYVEGDVLVRGRRLGQCGCERYNATLLKAIRGRDGWVVFIDDDDRPVDENVLATIASFCTDPSVMPVWRVRREAGRISPGVWRGDLNTPLGGLCWEAAAFHLSHVDKAIAAIDARCGADGRMWAALAKHLAVEWHDQVLFEPQQPGRAGKGYGKRRDKPLITVAVPILGRPERIPLVMRRFSDPRARPLFLPDEADEASINALEHLKATYLIAPPAAAFGVPTYASKVNHAFNVTDTEFLLYAADDVHPVGGWVDAALAHLRDESIGLLATNDELNHLNRRGVLATHGIVRRAYVERHGSASLEGSGPVFHEGYRHWCVDVEVSYAAIQRGAFRYAPDVILRHEHPNAGRSQRDATYDLGRDHSRADKALQARRVPTWPP